jgi:hypothetical protein
MIRDFWTKATPSIGRPPILVLSYKNHAIDEFLLDLSKLEPHLDMVRLGKAIRESSSSSACSF